MTHQDATTAGGSVTGLRPVAAAAAAAAGPVCASPAPLPPPRIPVRVRAGTADDLPFMDALQKLHAKQVGWMPTATLAGKIKLGHVLIAEAIGKDEGGGMKDEGNAEAGGDDACSVSPSSFIPPPSSLRPVGYLIAADQYFKRDDVGVVYQMNVVPGRQRGLVGAALLKAQFDRSAYGCKLYCCWCAQDLAANRFWEAMGFVPLAFRAGSERKSRIHIFWQKRIRAGDTGDVARGGTPWWFPSKTAGGSLREDRVVLPIPPGTHWSDAKPMILPTERPSVAEEAAEAATALAEPKRRAAAAVGKKVKAGEAKAVDAPPPPVRRNGLAFDIPQPGEPLPETVAAKTLKPEGPASKGPKPPRVKRACDPRLATAARELRDRWLERVNADPGLLAPAGKYEVARAVGHAGEPATHLLKAA